MSVVRCWMVAGSGRTAVGPAGWRRGQQRIYIVAGRRWSAGRRVRSVHGSGLCSVGGGGEGGRLWPVSSFCTSLLYTQTARALGTLPGPGYSAHPHQIARHFSSRSNHFSSPTRQFTMSFHVIPRPALCSPFSGLAIASRLCSFYIHMRRL